MPIKLNFQGVSTSRQFDPWPINEPVEFTIFNITQEKGKESGAPYLKFEFQQANGKRKAWRNFSLQPQSLWVLKKLLVELDYDEEELEADFDFDPADVLGKTVYLKFGEPKPYGDTMSQEVVSVSALEPEEA